MANSHTHSWQWTELQPNTYVLQYVSHQLYSVHSLVKNQCESVDLHYVIPSLTQFSATHTLTKQCVRTLPYVDYICKLYFTCTRSASVVREVQALPVYPSIAPERVE